jgi:type VI secretion system secreted protein VgrG
VFRYQNELEIVQVLFDEWRQSNGVLASAFEYELDPLFDMRQFPPREQTMQYNESDAAFVRRLLRRRGVAWTFRPGPQGAGDRSGLAFASNSIKLGKAGPDPAKGSPAS